MVVKWLIKSVQICGLEVDKMKPEQRVFFFFFNFINFNPHEFDILEYTNNFNEFELFFFLCLICIITY